MAWWPHRGAHIAAQLKCRGGKRFGLSKYSAGEESYGYENLLTMHTDMMGPAAVDGRNYVIF